MKLSFLCSYEWIYLVLLLCLIFQDSKAKWCTFPEFLYKVNGGTTGRIWFTHTWIQEGTNKIREQHEITAKHHSIVVRRKFHGRCRKGNEEVVCFRKEKLFTWKCKQKTKHYYVMDEIYADSREAIACISFKKRSDDVVQIYKGHLSNDSCVGTILVEDEWPWIAGKLSSKPRCPFQGGYTFEVVSDSGNKSLCVDTWLPARMELECVIGEGVDLIFPRADCNPIANKTEMRLQCWSHWTYRSWTYIILAEEDLLIQPTLLMRFPHTTEIQELSATGKTFIGFLYPVLIAPTTSNGLPSFTRNQNVKVIKLSVTPSDRRLCHDESRDCSELAKRSWACKSDAMVPNFCKHSCQRCSSAPSPYAECLFPKEMQGTWVLFEQDRTEEIVITDERVTVGQQVLVCKGVIDWTEKLFKVISFLNNGCRPRYLCVQIVKEDRNILKYRISRSDRLDKSSSLCSFKDDTGPWGSLLRSARPKVIVAKEAIRWNTCGLNGQLPVTVTLPEYGEVCRAEISDWTKETCKPKSSLSITTVQCSHHTIINLNRDYKCLAYLEIPGRSTVLLLKEQNQLTCWVIEAYPPAARRSPWKLLQHVPDVSCWSIISSHYLPESFPSKGFLMQPIHAEYKPPVCQKRESKNSSRSQNREEILPWSDKLNHSNKCTYVQLYFLIGCLLVLLIYE